MTKLREILEKWLDRDFDSVAIGMIKDEIREHFRKDEQKRFIGMLPEKEKLHKETVFVKAYIETFGEIHGTALHKQYLEAIKYLNVKITEKNETIDQMRKNLEGNTVSLCKHCNCMTHTVHGKCGKCKGDK